jgi:small-conductance mechanosensitive channel
LLASLLVLLSFWAVASLVRWLMRVLFRRIVSDLTVENLIKQIAYYTVWAIGLVVATSALGFNPQALATGLGLTGVALGFALKDILANFVSGILILAMRPFEIGDQIVIGETEGSVERINLRATEIRTYDGRAVLVPNAEVFTSRVTNNTESPIRRGTIEVPLGYDSDLKTAVETVCEAAQKASGVLDEPPASVRVRELKQDDIILEARFWTDSRRTDFVSTSSNVRAAIVKAFKAAAIGLPDPDVRILVSRPSK